MSEVAETIKRQLDDLSAQDQAELAHYLLGRLNETDDPEEAAFIAELDRRMAAIDNGTEPGIDAEEFFAQRRRPAP